MTRTTIPHKYEKAWQVYALEKFGVIFTAGMSLQELEPRLEELIRAAEMEGISKSRAFKERRKVPA